MTYFIDYLGENVVRQHMLAGFGVLSKDTSNCSQERLGIKSIVLAGNQTQVSCLEGSYANHYTTNTTICSAKNDQCSISVHVVYKCVVFWIEMFSQLL